MHELIKKPEFNQAFFLLEISELELMLLNKEIRCIIWMFLKLDMYYLIGIIR